MYKRLIRPILFKLSPEIAHKLIFSSLKVIKYLPFIKLLLFRYYSVKNNELSRNVFGLHFQNPVGLAAGLDKNGEVYNELACFGFGFIEIGTVTPKPQQGNPKPRLFRLIEDLALINRMGFNNNGIEEMVKKLRKRQKNIILGGNIGKNTSTSNKDAVSDYIICFNKIYPFVDYIAINVSCPNVENLRDLQQEDSLELILKSIENERLKYEIRKPVLLKISPDSSFQHLDITIDLCFKYKIDGVIATNTTTSREGLISDNQYIDSIGKGGLSGKPLQEKSTEIIKYIAQKSNGNLPIIGCGGIFSGKDAMEKIHAGASLIQIYTGFIYEGPGIVKNVNNAIINSQM